MERILKKLPIFLFFIGLLILEGNVKEVKAESYRINYSREAVSSYQGCSKSDGYYGKVGYVNIWDADRSNTIKELSYTITKNGQLIDDGSSYTASSYINYCAFPVTIYGTGQYVAKVNLTTTNGGSGSAGFDFYVYDITPVISSNPSAKAVKSGTSVSFSTSISQGTNVSYQWYYSSDGGNTYNAISGATSSSYTILAGSVTSSLNGRYYRCRLSNDNSENKYIYTSSAKLTVYSAPTVTITPSSTGVREGIGKTFSVSVSGGYPTNYTYQWYYATSQSGTGTRISGATSSSYTITSNNMTSSLNGRYYYCVVSNGQYDVESSRTKLTVFYAPTVTVPLSKNVTVGTSATFSVSASGGNPSSYTYQWYYAASQTGTGTRIRGATSSSYTISSSDMTSSLNGRYYYCVVSTSWHDVQSGRAKLTVTESGSNTPTGTPSNPVHHCTQENDGSDYTDWSYVYFGSYPQSEVTGSALTAAITGANYDANGDAWVNGTKYRRISKSDTNYDGYFGDSTYRYFKWERIKWRVLKNNGSTLFIVADKCLDCKDYHDPGGSVTWESSTIRSWLNDDFYQTAFSIKEQNAIVQQSIINEDNPQYGTEGGSNTQDNIYLLSVAEVTNPEYGFCENEKIHSASRGMQSSDYAHAMGAFISSDSSTVGNNNGIWWLRSPDPLVSSSKSFMRVDSFGNLLHFSTNGPIFNNRACVPALHINLSSDLWLQTDDGTSGAGGGMVSVSGPIFHNIKAGTSVVFSVTATGGSSSYYTYQWYYASSETGTGTRISGATLASYTIPSSDVTFGLNGRYYYCVVSNGRYDVTSNRAKLTVYRAPNVTSPSSKSVKAGISATFSISVSGGNPSNYTYQWYYAASSKGIGTRIDGATSASYTIPSSDVTSSLNGRYYYCVVSNGQYTVASDRAKLTVQSDTASSTNVPPTVNGLTEWYTAAAGTSLDLEVTASGGKPDVYTYQWYYAASETGAGTKINGAVSSKYTISASEMNKSLDGRYYYCVVSNEAYQVASRRTKIFVYNEPDQKPSADHILKKLVSAREATCTEDGAIACYYCITCGKYFADANGTKEIANGSWIIKAAGHHIEKHVENSSAKKDGSVKYRCSVCGYEEASFPIPRKQMEIELGKKLSSVITDGSKCTFALQNKKDKKYFTLNKKTGKLTVKEKNYSKISKKPVTVSVSTAAGTYPVKVTPKIPAPKIKKIIPKKDEGNYYRFTFQYNVKNASKIQVRCNLKGVKSAGFDKYLSRPKSTSGSYIYMKVGAKKKVTFTITAYYGKNVSKTAKVTVKIPK